MKAASRSGRAGWLVLLCVTLSPGAALALGVIETPDGSDTENGIGVISGWHCEGDLIQVRIDGGELITAAARTPRDDTLPVCSRSDTGFATLVNFSRLEPYVFYSPGGGVVFPGGPEHEIVAYADGVEFDRVTFKTTNFGESYTRGLAGAYELLNFPALGDTTIVGWSESKQDFTVRSTPASHSPGRAYDAPRISGKYHGALSFHYEYDDYVVHATFDVELDDSRFTVSIEWPDGSRCEPL